MPAPLTACLRTGPHTTHPLWPSCTTTAQHPAVPVWSTNAAPLSLLPSMEVRPATRLSAPLPATLTSRALWTARSASGHLCTLPTAPLLAPRPAVAVSRLLLVPLLCSPRPTVLPALPSPSKSRATLRPAPALISTARTLAHMATASLMAVLHVTALPLRLKPQHLRMTSTATTSCSILMQCLLATARHT